MIRNIVDGFAAGFICCALGFNPLQWQWWVITLGLLIITLPRTEN